MSLLLKYLNTTRKSMMTIFNDKKCIHTSLSIGSINLRLHIHICTSFTIYVVFLKHLNMNSQFENKEAGIIKFTCLLKSQY